jgi:hypothetical protein
MTVQYFEVIGVALSAITLMSNYISVEQLLTTTCNPLNYSTSLAYKVNNRSRLRNSTSPQICYWLVLVHLFQSKQHLLL